MTNRIFYRLCVLMLVMMVTAGFGNQTTLTHANSQLAKVEIKEKAAENICSSDLTDHAQIFLPIAGTSIDNSAPTPDPLIRELRYEVGKTYTYQYELQSYSVFGTTDLNGVNEGDPNRALSSGNAEIAITGMADEETYIGEIVLLDATACQQNGDGEDSFIEDDDTFKDWQTPVIFHQRKDGVITLVKVADSVDPINANFQKAVVNALQATLKANDDNYGAIENGLQGKYLAEYKSNLQANGLSLTKSMDQNSFTEFYSQGDEPVVLLDNTIYMHLDREMGVFSSISYAENIDVFPETDALDEQTAGVSIWGETKSSGNLRLIEVADTAQSRHVQQVSLSYQITNLDIEFGEIEPPTHGIDISTLDIDAELDAFEAGILDPNQFARMTWVVAADEKNPAGAVTPHKIRERLIANLANESVARGYIDLLGHVQTENAQLLLAELIDPSSSLSMNVSDSLKTQVFTNLPRLEVPTVATINLMVAMMNNETLPAAQQEMSTMALGSLSAAISSSDSTTAQAAITQLEDRLQKSSTDKEKAIIVRALGNSASPDLLPIIQPYLASENFELQWAAYWSLRDLPGKEVEDLYLAAFDNDPEGVPPAPGVKPGIAQILKNKPGKPSDGVKDIIDNYYETPEGGSIPKSWNTNFGGETVGGSLPGEFILTSPPDAMRLEASAHQSINYHIKLEKINFSKTGSAAHAHAWTKAKDATTQQFGYSYTVLGKDIEVVEKNVACAYNKSDNILKGHSQLFDYSFSYSVYGPIVVSTNLQAFINYSLDYELDLDLCSASSMESKVNLTAHADANASASAALGTKRLQGGVEVDVDIVNVTAAGNLTGTYDLQDGFEACFVLPLKFKALDVKFYLFAEGRLLVSNPWNRFYEKLLYKSDPVVDKDTNLVDECWTLE